jgi:biotin carboxyl carrier protein
VLPPQVWLKKGGFNLGEKFEIADAYGKLHVIEIGPQRKTKDGDAVTYFNIDHHPEPIFTELEQESDGKKGGNDQFKKKVSISLKELNDLAKAGDVRSQMIGTVSSIPVTEGQEVSAGEVLIVLEAMKMLTNVLSEMNGKISEIFVAPGDKVEVGDPLISISKAK